MRKTLHFTVPQHHIAPHSTRQSTRRIYIYICVHPMWQSVNEKWPSVKNAFMPWSQLHTHTHLRIRCRSKISMCLDTLITREQERMNGTERFGLCVVWPRSREGKKQNSKQEFATNCTFLSTMISFFENFTSASVKNYNYNNNNNNQIITFYSGLVRSHATPAASFRYTHTHTHAEHGD